MKRMPINELHCSLPALSVNEQTARMLVAAFALQCDPTAEALADLKTAVSEAVTNAIVHGYRHQSGLVYITCRLYENAEIWVRIRDKGCGIEDIPKAMEPLYTSAPEEERAGLGFAVMEAFCDHLRVTSRPGKGTSVFLTKFLSNRQNHGKE